MNAKLINQIITGVRKNDRSDAQKLALIAQYGDLLRYSYVPSPEEANLRELTRMRLSYKKETTKIKNRIKKNFSMYGFNWEFSFDYQGVLKFLIAFLKTKYSMGHFIALCEKTGIFGNMKRYFNDLKKYEDLDLPKGTRNLLIFCFHSLMIHEEEINLLEKQIFEVVESLPKFTEMLRFIEPMPGTQELSRISLLAEIGDIKRFPTAGDVAVYAGIAPRGGTSGLENKNSTQEKQVKRDRPNRKCNRYLKNILIQAARTILRMREDKRDVDDICRYACRFPKQKDRYFKHLFKIAAKWIRKLFYCLINRKIYNPLIGLQDNNPVKKRTRHLRLKKLKREMYHRSMVMKHKIANIYDQMAKMGIAEEVINKIRGECEIKTYIGGV